MNLGDASGYGKISGGYFPLGAGADIEPLLKGIEGDLYQSPIANDGWCGCSSGVRLR